MSTALPDPCAIAPEPPPDLPVADRAALRRRTAVLVRTHRRPLVASVLLHAAAAVAGLAGPVLLGR
ncbi:MAG: hypothetical protein M3Q27_15310, partial [Actinomycetota bacterium]|nr:hypothetical protein [Actinomycetota bacterium]